MMKQTKPIKFRMMLSGMLHAMNVLPKTHNMAHLAMFQLRNNK